MRKRRQGIEQAVIAHFRYGSTDLRRLYALEDQLETVIGASEAGALDGHDIAADGSDGFLYMYGPDADRLFEVAMPVLKSVDFMEGATVKRRYGPPKSETREVTVTISVHFRGAEFNQ